MFKVTQRLPDGGTIKIFINLDNIERIIPWKGGALINHVSGNETVIMETPEEIVAKSEEK